MPTIECPDDLQLRRYVLGRLGAGPSTSVESHVADCPSCLQRLEVWFGEEDALLRLLRQPLPHDLYAAEARQRQSAMTVCETIDFSRSNGSDSTAVVEPPFLPERLGDYAIVKSIGAGGMGAIYLARHLRLGREVAIKVLPPDRSHDQSAIQRFQKELLASGKLLNHPNVVSIYDARHEDGRDLLIMEYIRGEDLSHRVSREGPMSMHAAVDCLLQAAEGLAYAHQQGIVHRDIKPSNLMMQEDGRVKVLDLGVAQLGDAGFEEVASPDDHALIDGLTKTGFLMGSLHYMSPEQATNAKNVDPRADIYSLGCTFYLLLTGKPPFEGESVGEIVMAHRKAPIPSLQSARDDVTDELELIYRRMVAKDPSDRYASMPEVIDDLRRVMSKLSEDRNLSQFFQSLQTVQRSEAEGGLHSTSTFPGTVMDRADVTQPMMQRALRDVPTLESRRHLPWLIGFPFAVISLFLVLNSLSFWKRHDTTTPSLEIDAPQTLRCNVVRRHTIRFSKQPGMIGAICPRTETLAAIEGESVRFWDLTTAKGSPPHRLSSQLIRAAAFRSDGLQIAVGGDSPVVHVWDVSSQQTVSRLTDNVTAVTVLAYSPQQESRFLASGSEDGTVCVWDVDGYQRIWMEPAHGSAIRSLAFSPVEPGLLVTSGDDGKIRVWRVDRTHANPIREYTESQTVGNLTFLGNRNQLVGAGTESRVGWIKRWDLNRDAPGQIVANATSMVVGLGLAFGGEELVLSTTDDNLLRMNCLDFRASSVDVGPLQSSVMQSVTDGGHRVAIVSTNDPIRVIDLDGQAPITELPGGGAFATVVKLSSDEQAIIAGCAGDTSGFLRCWELETGEERESWGIPVVLAHENNTPLDIAVTSASEEIAVVNGTSVVALWSHESGTLTHTFASTYGPLRSVALSSDGRYLAAAAEDAGVLVWDRRDGLHDGLASRHSGEVTDVEFSTDSRSMWSVGHDRTVQKWDLEKRSVTYRRDLPNPLTSLTFDDDESHIAVTDDRGNVYLIEVEAERLEGPFRVHVSRIHDACLVVPGVLATASVDRTLRFWSLSTHRMLHVVDQFREEIHSLAARSDGQLITSSRDGTIGLWKVALVPNTPTGELP